MTDAKLRPRTQIVWWFPRWVGVRWFRWGEGANCFFRWSLALGFVELRRIRPKHETDELFAALRARSNP